MKNNRSWISLLGFCLLTALGAALAFALVVAGASVALASHESSEPAQNSEQVQDQQPAPPHSELTTFNGMITDSICGARHRRYPNLTPTECAAACIRSGAHYVLVDGDHRYILSGSNQSLEKLLGTRANVTGTLDGDTITVNSAAPMF